MPDERMGKTVRIKVDGMKIYLTHNPYPDTGKLGEIFLSCSKEGSTVSGLLDSISIFFSMALQHGVPLEDLVEKMEGQRFEPSDHRSSSIMDAVAKYLKSKYLAPSPEEVIHTSTLRNVKEA